MTRNTSFISSISRGMSKEVIPSVFSEVQEISSTQSGPVRKHERVLKKKIIEQDTKPEPKGHTRTKHCHIESKQELHVVS